MKKQNPKLVFLGTADFAVPIFKALCGNGWAPALVITQPDQPVGRRQTRQSPPLKPAADLARIPVRQPATNRELHAIIAEEKPDLCVLVAYGTLIKKETLAIPAKGFINIHPSLLPLYRGPSPIQSAILNGDKFSGVSIMLLDDQMDHGPILAQEKLPVLPTDTMPTLQDRLAVLAADLLVRTLPAYVADKLKAQPQDDQAATYSRIITREDGQLNWQDSAVQIDRQFRAYFPWPAVFTLWAGKRLKIANLSVLEGISGAGLRPGAVFLANNKTLAVQCGQGVISLNRVQLEGKKEMSALEFLKGYQAIIGQQLGSATAAKKD